MARFTLILTLSLVFALSACGGGSVPNAATGNGASLSSRAAGTAAVAAETSVPSVLQPDFSFASGSNPTGTLIDVAGMKYGVSSGGGANGEGTVFSLTPSGTATVIYSVQGGTPNGGPYYALVNVGGTLYGTTSSGGTYGHGTVFSITPSGTESVVYSFRGYSDGAIPSSPLIDVGGTLYGTTLEGGRIIDNNDGYGTVYSVTPSGVENVIYRFKGFHDGIHPEGTLADVDGTFYGTTPIGGALHDGTVFGVGPLGHERIVYSFKGSSDAGFPYTGLVAAGHTLYGTTAVGGSNELGTIFSVTTSGVEQVIHRFVGGADGSDPQAGLVYVESKNLLFGTTFTGGSDNVGTIFSVTPGGTETVLRNFHKNNIDPYNPSNGLTNVNGVLYGITAYGGANGDGAVYHTDFPL